MAGYIIELYKNIISDGNYGTKQSVSDSELTKRSYLTFGEFDKMAVSRTNAFSRMRDVSKMSKEWIGDRQKILLFELAEDNQLEYREEGETCGFFLSGGPKASLCRKLFLGLTIFQFRESQEESGGIRECLNACRRNILKLVGEHSDMECSVFGLLGTYGVAVLWAADQFTDILGMINQIKGSDILADNKPAYKFISVFTILAKNKDWAGEEKLSALRGTAVLQMTLQTNLYEEMMKTLREEFPKAARLHTVGEYDLTLKMPARVLFNCFEKGRIFHPESDFYKKHILQTNVRLCNSIEKSRLESAENEDVKKDKDSDNLQVYVAEIKKCYSSLRKLFFDSFPKTAGMVDSLDLLFGDYISKIASVSNKMWAKDYSQQFRAILQLLEKNITTALDGQTNVTTEILLKDTQDLLNCFEYQTIHIAESDNLLLDTPKCHLRYTGHNNLTLYAYFGIIKELLELAYRMQKESRQSRIIPLISVDTVPVISSLMYMDYTSPFDDRIIRLNLPMMAMYELPVYAPYLYHEVFHYVAPGDRVVRNWAKGSILAVCAMKHVVGELLRSAAGELHEEAAFDLLEGVLFPEIYRIVLKKYHDPLVVRLQRDISESYTREQINKESMAWLQYEEWLMDQLEKYVRCPEAGVLEDNLVYAVLKGLRGESKEESSVSGADGAEGAFEPEKKEELEILGKLWESMAGLFENINPLAQTRVLKQVLEGTGLSVERLLDTEGLIQLSDAIKEVVCDIPMLELSRMNETEYLITYVKIQNDLLKQKASVRQIQHGIRIGVVLDCFFGWNTKNGDKQRRLEGLQSDFVCSYIALSFSEKKASETDDLRFYVGSIKKEAEGWFKKIQGWYWDYLGEYGIFGDLFQSIVNQSSVKKRISEEEYPLRERFKCLKVSEYHAAVRRYGTEVLRTVGNDLLSDAEKKAKISEVRDLFRREVFDYNIDIILTFQKQKSFEELGEICESCFRKQELYELAISPEEKKRVKSTREPASPEMCFAGWKYRVQNISELFLVIRNISDHLERAGSRQYGDKGNGLWYRGHEDSSYKLLPTAMRRYAKHAGRAENLRGYQRSAYEEFKFRMDNASEKIEKAGYTECDYLALMQHYGAPTIYMDWTENAISALYFALEAYMDPKKAGNQNDKPAALYILQPNLYNEARKQIMEPVKAETGRIIDRWMEDSKLKNTSSLLNLSVQYNSDKFGMFLLGSRVEERDIEKPSEERIEKLSRYDKPENLLYLPLAIYASRANKRVRVQSGMFMAFNIFTRPSEKRYFDYMALENIQKFYLDNFPDAEPFLYEVEIDPGSKKEIAEWLRAIGVTKDMVYPELVNIGERIL